MYPTLGESRNPQPAVTDSMQPAWQWLLLPAQNLNTTCNTTDTTHPTMRLGEGTGFLSELIPGSGLPTDLDQQIVSHLGAISPLAVIRLCSVSKVSTAQPSYQLLAQSRIRRTAQTH
jgi:hypothetical protein